MLVPRSIHDATCDETDERRKVEIRPPPWRNLSFNSLYLDISLRDLGDLEGGNNSCYETPS